MSIKRALTFKTVITYSGSLFSWLVHQRNRSSGSPGQTLQKLPTGRQVLFSKFEDSL